MDVVNFSLSLSQGLKSLFMLVCWTGSALLRPCQLARAELGVQNFGRCSLVRALPAVL